MHAFRRVVLYICQIASKKKKHNSEERKHRRSTKTVSHEKGEWACQLVRWISAKTKQQVAEPKVKFQKAKLVNDASKFEGRIESARL